MIMLKNKAVCDEDWRCSTKIVKLMIVQKLWIEFKAAPKIICSHFIHSLFFVKYDWLIFNLFDL